MTKELQAKIEKLQNYLRELGSVAVAFSGGVDSTYLLKVAHDTLGDDNVIAFTAGSAFVPERDLDESKVFCEREGIKHLVVRFDILSVDGIKNNPENRCYLCKYALFSHLKELAKQNGKNYVVDGSNLDDDGDYRPGRKALGELDIKSPLHYAGMRKQDIRDASHELNLPTWDKPSFACLASRFVYGEKLTPEKLNLVNRAEEYLLSKGFKQFRVRIHDDLARIELLPEDIDRFMAMGIREEVAKKFKEFGFAYVALDLQGYRTGSMNEVLKDEKKNA